MIVAMVIAPASVTASAPTSTATAALPPRRDTAASTAIRKYGERNQSHAVCSVSPSAAASALSTESPLMVSSAPATTLASVAIVITETGETLRAVTAESVARRDQRADDAERQQSHRERQPSASTGTPHPESDGDHAGIGPEHKPSRPVDGHAERRHPNEDDPGASHARNP